MIGHKICTLTEGANNEIYQGTKLSISLKRNRDKTQIFDFSNFDGIGGAKTGGLKVYLVEKADSDTDASFFNKCKNFNPAGKTAIYNIESYADFDSAGIKPAGEGDAILSIETSGIDAGKTYGLIVVGKDVDGNSFEPNDEDGEVSGNSKWVIFQVVTSGSKPSILLTSLPKTYYRKSDKIEVAEFKIERADTSRKWKINTLFHHRLMLELKRA